MRLPDASETEEIEQPGPELARRLQRDYGALDTLPLLEVLLRHVFPGRVAMVSSFGAESAVLLDLIAEVDRSIPVLFLDTDQLFEETLRYRDTLAARLGLTDVRVLRPAPAELAADDPDGQLWYFDPDHCCRIRKVLPLDRGLEGFDAWITGRKRFQGGLRGRLSAIEAGPDGRIKINPLAGWTPREMAARFASRNLPQHPLLAQGFPSIGCMPCTDKVNAGEDPRAGRWRDRPKTECGIHLPM